MNPTQIVNSMYAIGMSAREIDLRIQQLIKKPLDESLPFLVLRMDRMEVLYHMMEGSSSPNMYGENSVFHINGYYPPTEIVPKARLYHVNREDIFELGKIYSELAERGIQIKMFHPGTIGQLIGRPTPFSQSGIVDVDGNPIEESDPRLIEVTSDLASVNDALLKRLIKNPEEIYGMPPASFEELVAELLERQGYSTQLTSRSGDGGVDIYASQKTGIGTFLYLVQCKRNSPKNRVGPRVVRELHGVIQQERATAGLIVTTSFFTKGALEYREKMKHQMSLWDYSNVISNIRDALPSKSLTKR